ncbi:MAG: KH domain-containing protein [Candidatus Obscuribacter phosphatis]|uniref:KH domain-containing protein n=1 Tax=Candidatus Obscuribacter phosphatis TaxID=1906157 RepID=A0A8J7TNQ1_9BACT|nr:KH domain-containing protein [Candidatus Obscuribacter phosphatis]
MNLSQFDDNAKSYLEKILAILDIEAEVLQEDVDDTTTCYRIECKSDDARILIGKNGQTLESLQFVVRQMVKSKTLDRSHFIVDVCDYRGRRRRTLEEQAKKGAVAVLNGDSERFPLMPMTAYDRRLVHNYLQENFPDLASESEGEGEGRHIVISFKGLEDGEGGEDHGDDAHDGDVEE